MNVLQYPSRSSLPNSARRKRILIAFALVSLGACSGFGGILYEASVYRFNGNRNLDMAEWFEINMGLTLKLIPVALVGGALCITAAVAYLCPPRVSGILLNAIFWAMWTASIGALCLLALSRVP